MLYATLPFDYLQHIVQGDRIRRPRIRSNGSRVRRGSPAGAGE